MASAGPLDTLLDRAVVPGYSRIGYAVRSPHWHDDPPADALAGRTVAVTGANSGLGEAAVRGVVALGGTVRMLCRDTAKGKRVRDAVLADHPDAALTIDACDVSDLESVRTAAGRLSDELAGLHGLVHNAGVLPPERTETPAGHELTLATHVLGPHLLTALVRPLLAADGDARVVFVSSGGMYAQPLRIGDLEFRHGRYTGTGAYARTKRMQVVLAQVWAGELASDGVRVHAMHPGWADTPGVTDSLPGFAKVMAPVLRTPAQGADTIVWLLAADEPGARTGLFWQDRRPRPTSYLPWTRSTPSDARALFDYACAATGIAGGS